jgi:hypothetical protein
MAQRNGQGIALRTDMRGALMVSRLLNNLNLIFLYILPKQQSRIK